MHHMSKILSFWDIPRSKTCIEQELFHESSLRSQKFNLNIVKVSEREWAEGPLAQFWMSAFQNFAKLIKIQRVFLFKY